MIVVKLNHLNLLLHFNKTYNHNYCQVQPSYGYHLHSTPHVYCRVIYELELDLLNPLYVDFKSQYISSSS